MNLRGRGSSRERETPNPARGAGNLLADLLEAASEPAHWPGFLDRLARLLNGAGAHLFRVDERTGGIDFEQSSGLGKEFLRAYREVHASSDGRLRALLRKPSGVPYPSRMLLPKETDLRSDLYNRLLLPSGLRCSLSAVLLEEGRRKTVLVVYRRRQQRPFGEKEVRSCGALIPSFRRVLQIHNELDRTSAELGTWLEVVDLASVGIVLADASGEPLRMNRLAREILALADGVRIEKGVISAGTREESVRLRALIQKESRASPGETGSVMLVSRPSGLRPHIVKVASLRERIWRPGASVVLFLRDSGREYRVHWPEFVRFYDISPAEFRVLYGLSNGKRLQELARESGLSTHTVRSQLKSIFQKTHTHRQSELLRHLWDFARGARWNPGPND